MSYKTVLENLVRDTLVHIDLQVSSSNKSINAIERAKTSEEERDGLTHRWVDGTVLGVKNSLVIVQLHNDVCVFVCKLPLFF